MPSGRTNRLPPCRSPWKTPNSMAPSRKAIMQGPDHRGGVDAGGVHAGDVVEGEAVEALHDQHPPGDQLRDGAGGRPRERWSVAARTRAMSSMLSASSRKSSSSTMVSANSSTSAGGLASAATGMRPTRNGAIQLMAARSVRTVVATAGRCTLTTTSSPVRRRGGVDLGDRRGGERRPVEAGEDLLERPAEVLLDDGPDGLERLGRHLVAEQPELADQLGGEEALAGGEDLAELDVGRARGVSKAMRSRRDSPARDSSGRPSRRRPAAVDQVPAAEGLAELGADPDHPPAGRQAAPAEQLGDLGRRCRARRPGRPGRHVSWSRVDQPGGCPGAERADGQVAGGGGRATDVIVLDA